MPFNLRAAAHDLIALDSRSSLSDRPVVEFLAPLCRDVGLRVEVMSEVRDGVEQCDLVAFRDGPGDDSLLLTTHLDTVPPGEPSLWTACSGRPFDCIEHDGVMYGLGVADVKLDFLCKLAALDSLRSEVLTQSVILAGTYGEEIGRYGARLLTDRLRPLPAIVFVGEPSGLRPCVAHKGYVEIHVLGRASDCVAVPEGPCWELRFEGIAAHSSQTNRGRSATDACLASLTRLAAGAGCAVLSVEGSQVVNMVAAAARAVIVSDDPPPMPDNSACVAIDRPDAATWSPGLLAALLEVHRSCNELRTDFESTVTVGFDPAFSTVNNGIVDLDANGFRHVVDVRRLPGEAPQLALDAHLERLGDLAAAGLCQLDVECRLDTPLPREPELKSGTTEASVYSEAGIDTVIFGPGQATDNIHKPNEHVPLEHLWRAIDVYGDVTRSLSRASSLGPSRRRTAR